MAGLIAIGANPNELTPLSKDLACYPLDYAIINLNAEAVAELIKLGARTYRQDALKIAEQKATRPYGASATASFFMQKVLADKQKIAAMLEALNSSTPSSVVTSISSAQGAGSEAGSPLSSVP
ncbi:MAG: hypothetical protein K0Q57_1298 [Gammaproteobacteria bacterium]|nr:hypothetical protein [Gammaproteobacteria bacterium]